MSDCGWRQSVAEQLIAVHDGVLKGDQIGEQWRGGAAFRHRGSVRCQTLIGQGERRYVHGHAASETCGHRESRLRML